MTNSAFEDSQKPLIIPGESEDKATLPQASLFNNQIILNPSISKTNFIAFLLYSFFVGTILLPLNALQEPLLTNIYNLTASEAADANSLFQLTQIGASVLLAPLFGFLCDKYGRKMFIVIGVIVLTISIVLLPNLPNAYPSFFFLQVLLGVGVLAINISPFLADYIDNRTKGRVAGIATVFNFLGAATATLINQFADLNKNLKQQYYKLGALDLVIGIIIIFGLKGGQYYKNFSDKTQERAKEITESESEKEALGASNLENSTIGVAINDASATLKNTEKKKEEGLSLKDGIKAAQNPWILAGYISYFLGLQFINLLGYPMVTYVKALVSQDDQAASQASALATVGLGTGVVISFCTGVLADKWNKFRILVIALLNSLLGSALIILIKNPYSFVEYIAMISCGASAGTFITLATQFLGRYAAPKYRASVSSLGAICALVGGVITNILGVYLSKYYYLYPFFIYSGFALICLILLMILYGYKKSVLNTL